MKIAYYKDGNKEIYGVLKGEQIHEVNGDVFGEYTVNEAGKSIDDVEILPPVKPGKLICVGLNYSMHARESNKEIPEVPMIFMCSPSAIIADNAPIILDNHEDPIDYEAELAIIIGKQCKNVSKETFADYILGYSCSNDISNRYLQKKDGQFTRAKSYDTYKPLGSLIETDVDPDNLPIKLWQNGEIKQDSNTSDMIFSTGEIIEFISNVMTLDPGDVILTGTPEGVGNLKSGDKIEIEIEGIGRLRNVVE